MAYYGFSFSANSEIIHFQSGPGQESNLRQNSNIMNACECVRKGEVVNKIAKELQNTKKNNPDLYKAYNNIVGQSQDIPYSNHDPHSLGKPRGGLTFFRQVASRKTTEMNCFFTVDCSFQKLVGR